MFTLNFPNGNTQTYPDKSSMFSAARAMGGDAVMVSQYIYAFVPKK